MKDDNVKSDFEKLLELSAYDALNVIQKELEELPIQEEHSDDNEGSSQNPESVLK